MKPSDTNLARIAGESSRHVAASRTSCQETRDHIAQSRAAITLSLGLLRRCGVARPQ